MSRIFSVRINLDEINAFLLRWRSPHSRSDWLDGFLAGCSGVDMDGTDPFTQANKLGLVYHGHATAFQITQADKANKRWHATAMPRHESGNATAMPVHMPGCMPGCMPEVCLSNNRIIEVSREPVIKNPTTPDKPARKPRVESPEQAFIKTYKGKICGTPQEKANGLKEAIAKYGMEETARRIGLFNGENIWPNKLMWKLASFDLPTERDMVAETDEYMAKWNASPEGKKASALRARLQAQIEARANQDRSRVDQ